MVLGRGAMVPGRRETYVKQRELTRAVLLNFAKQNGYIVPVTLIEVNVSTFGGTTFDIVMEEGSSCSSTVRDLICIRTWMRGPVPQRGKILVLVYRHLFWTTAATGRCAGWCGCVCGESS